MRGITNMVPPSDNEARKTDKSEKPKYWLTEFAKWSFGICAVPVIWTMIADAINSKPSSPPVTEVSLPSSTPEPSDDGRRFVSDTAKKLQTAHEAMGAFMATLRETQTIPSSEQREWQIRLDEALLGLSDAGYLLQQDTTTEGAALPTSVVILRKKREALGREMVQFTFDLRASMPLLTEADDRPVDMVKFKAATKRYGQVTSLYEATAAQFAEASKTLK